MPVATGGHALFRRRPASRKDGREGHGPGRRLSDPAGVELSGDCTCGPGGRCGHVLAVLLHVLDRTSRDEPARTARRRLAHPARVGHRASRRGTRPTRSRKAPGALPAGRPGPLPATRGSPRAGLPAQGRPVRRHEAPRSHRRGAQRRPTWPSKIGSCCRPSSATRCSPGPLRASSAPVAIDPQAAASLLERLLATGRCHWRSKDDARPAAGRSKNRADRMVARPVRAGSARGSPSTVRTMRSGSRSNPRGTSTGGSPLRARCGWRSIPAP